MVNSPDIEKYLAALIEAGGKLLHLVDRDPLSPTRGCFDYHFWRSKSSGFPNARLQEAAYTLALLYRRPYPGNRWRGNPEVGELAGAALSFWSGLAHRDGSFDEWYRGEHGYAATAFSCLAAAGAFSLLRDELGSRLGECLAQSLARGARWLARHRDLAKINHEAVGAAALYEISAALDAPDLTKAAADKVAEILSRQDAEGWFPELGGMDSGYCFLTLEHLARCWSFSRDPGLADALRRCLVFLADLVQPDLTTGREYNLCGNAYVSLLGAAILGEVSPLARRIFLEGVSRPRAALEALAQDDLSACYHLYNGFLAVEAYERTRDSYREEPPELPCRGEPFLRRYDRAGIVALRRRGYYAVSAPIVGGLVKIYADGGDLWIDRGFRVELPDSSALISWARGGSTPVDDIEPSSSVRSVSRLRPASYYYPGRTVRFILALVSSLPGGFLLIKRGLDFFRRRKGASLQLSTVSGADSGWVLAREASFQADRVIIRDSLEGKPALSRFWPEQARWRAGVRVSPPASARPGGPGPFKVETVLDVSAGQIRPDFAEARPDDG